MYKIKNKNIKKELLVNGIFIVLGIISLIAIVGYIVYMNVRNNRMDAKTNATFVERICDDEGSCEPRFTYVVDGEEYICNCNYSSTDFTSVDTKIIKYNSSNPSECVSQYELSHMWFVYLFILFPLIFMGVGIGLMISPIKKMKKRKILNETGTLYRNLPYNVEYSTTSINGRSVPKLTVRWTHPSGEEFELESDLRFDFKTQDEDGCVDLLIDVNDPTNYYIDLNIEIDDRY